jgi:hypothetical protein
MDAEARNQYLRELREEYCLARKAVKSRLLLEQIPVKVAEEWDRRQVGNLQGDFVAHCGQSTAGPFLWTVPTVDIATHCWEGEPVMRLESKTRRGSKVHRRYDVAGHPLSAPAGIGPAQPGGAGEPGTALREPEPDPAAPADRAPAE